MESGSGLRGENKKIKAGLGNCEKQTARLDDLRVGVVRLKVRVGIRRAGVIGVWILEPNYRFRGL